MNYLRACVMTKLPCPWKNNNKLRHCERGPMITNFHTMGIRSKKIEVVLRKSSTQLAYVVVSELCA